MSNEENTNVFKTILSPFRPKLHGFTVINTHRMEIIRNVSKKISPIMLGTKKIDHEKSQKTQNRIINKNNNQHVCAFCILR